MDHLCTLRVLPDTQLLPVLPRTAPENSGIQKGLPGAPRATWVASAAEQLPRQEGGSEGLLQATGGPAAHRRPHPPWLLPAPNLGGLASRAAVSRLRREASLVLKRSFRLYCKCRRSTAFLGIKPSRCLARPTLEQASLQGAETGLRGHQALQTGPGKG